MSKKVKIGEFLNKYKLVTKEVISLDYHLYILNSSLEDFVFRMIREGYIRKDDSLSEEVLANCIYKLILKTNADSKDYDIKLDSILTNIGLKLPRIGCSVSHSKWNGTGLIDDDGFGFGTEVTSIYDNFVDSYNDEINKHRK